jgi:atypical dual specificity phosphatase
LIGKISDLFRWIYGHITGKTTNFNWVVEEKLAGSALPTSFREIKWLYEQHGIRSIITIKEEPLESKWFENKRIDYLHKSIEEYGAPSLEELDYVVNYISRQIDNEKPVMVHCSGGKGRTGTILAGYLIKKNGFSAERAVYKLRILRGESIQSKEQKAVLFNYENYLKDIGLV